MDIAEIFRYFIAASSLLDRLHPVFVCYVVTSMLNTFLVSFFLRSFLTSFFGVIEPARGALQSYYGSLGSDVSVVFVMIEKLLRNKENF